VSVTVSGSVERLRRSFERLDREVADHVDLRAAAADALRRHVGFDVAVMATVDPTTVMWTHCLLVGMDRDAELEEQVFANEYAGGDVLGLTELLSAPGHGGTLQVASRERGTTSARLEHIYRPIGVTDELRVLLVDGDTPWGVICLLRSGGHFTGEELGAVGAVSSSFAVTLRRSLLGAALQRPGSLDVPPGLIACGPRGSETEMSDEARRLVEQLGVGEVPQVVAALRARLAAGVRAEAALATRDGRWLAFHATRMGEREVVIVEQVRSHRLAELIVRARGLTPRERDVVEWVARGAPTRAIARSLFISEWTVQDHLKAIFAKFGVRSRQELVAAIFFEHYGPRHAAEDTPSPYGWYLEPDGRSM
jgi:DNA-binding CsgD family transcriptional regulator